MRACKEKFDCMKHVFAFVLNDNTPRTGLFRCSCGFELENRDTPARRLRVAMIEHALEANDLLEVPLEVKWIW